MNNNYLPDNEVINYEDQQEIWKDIPGYDGLYQASSLGRIKRLPIHMVYSDGQRHFYPEKLYKMSVAGNGYKMVSLRRFDEAVATSTYVHRLVAETFIPNPNNYDVVNHIDSDKTNNRVDNLEWTTYSENSVHAFRRENKMGAVVAKPIICVETGVEFDNSAEAARWLEDLTTNLKASARNIWAAASGHRPTALGFHWKFKEDK